MRILRVLGVQLKPLRIWIYLLLTNEQKVLS